MVEGESVDENISSLIERMHARSHAAGQLVSKAEELANALKVSEATKGGLEAKLKGCKDRQAEAARAAEEKVRAADGVAETDREQAAAEVAQMRKELTNAEQQTQAVERELEQERAKSAEVTDLKNNIERQKEELQALRGAAADARDQIKEAMKEVEKARMDIPRGPAISREQLERYIAGLDEAATEGPKVQVMDSLIDRLNGLVAGANAGPPPTVATQVGDAAREAAAQIRGLVLGATGAEQSGGWKKQKSPSKRTQTKKLKKKKKKRPSSRGGARSQRRRTRRTRGRKRVRRRTRRSRR